MHGLSVNEIGESRLIRAKRALLFLEKKEAKKLLFTEASGAKSPETKSQKFFASFFKKEALSYFRSEIIVLVALLATHSRPAAAALPRDTVRNGNFPVKNSDFAI